MICMSIARPNRAFKIYNAGTDSAYKNHATGGGTTNGLSKLRSP